jgi:hypothetical protein
MSGKPAKALANGIGTSIPRFRDARKHGSWLGLVHTWLSPSDDLP